MADDFTRDFGGSYYTPHLQTWLEEVYVREPEAKLAAVRRAEQAGMPAIQISPLDGQLLFVLLRMIRAKRVVEIGTLSGYSGLWILEALGEGGRLFTIEADPNHAEVARGTFTAAGLGDRVDLRVGRGMDVLPELTPLAPFDAVFIDADKQGMPGYLAWASLHLRPGGLVLADNSFLFGYLTDRVPDDPSYNTVIDAVKSFHETLARDFDAVPISTPQGLAVGIKRG